VGFALAGQCGERCRRKQEAESIRGTLSPRSPEDRRARFPTRRIDFHLAHHAGARRRHRPILHGLLLVIISLAATYAIVTNGGFPGRSRAFAAPVTGLSLPAVSEGAAPLDQAVLRGPAINKTLPSDKPVAPRQQAVADQLAAFSATPTSVASVEQDAPLRAASVAPPPELPPYQIHDVKEGDTVSSIAARYQIDPAYIIANNPLIIDSDFLTLGQSLIIPAGNGILHEVRYGETLSDISARYDVDVETIAAFGANGITTPDDITEAQLVYVPGGQPLPSAPPPSEAATGGAEPETPAEAVAEPESGTGGGGGIVAGGAASSAGLIWPLQGPISSYYGPGHPLGIDIDGFNLVGASVGAATAGTVVFAGGNACCSYGLYVVVVSPGGIETLYAHLSSISVSQGQSVAQGEEIGVIGDSGYSTGVHLHFEVIDNGSRQNPLNYLP
jgi:murein DD-endopeptidase MepM/ murein hydrolase activator NlpD